MTTPAPHAPSPTADHPSLTHARQLALARLVRIVTESDDDAQARLAAAAILRLPDAASASSRGRPALRPNDSRATPDPDSPPRDVRPPSPPQVTRPARATSTRDLERLLRSLDRATDLLLTSDRPRTPTTHALLARSGAAAAHPARAAPPPRSPPLTAAGLPPLHGPTSLAMSVDSP